MPPIVAINLQKNIYRRDDVDDGARDDDDERCRRLQVGDVLLHSEEEPEERAVALQPTSIAPRPAADHLDQVL